MVTYYAHTAELPDGERDTDVSRWQLLSVHLRNVADLAKRFATPLNLAEKAELAGLLHDLGKYADRFQACLHDNSIRGINHWAGRRTKSWPRAMDCPARPIAQGNRRDARFASLLFSG